MLKRSRSGRILHAKRPVTTRRPMHLTAHVHGDVPSLRRAEVLGAFRELVREARRRGVRTVAFALMPTHLHWMVVPDSAGALRDATRYVFGQLAKRVNALAGRRGKVFLERFWSTCCASVRQAFHALGYVLKNAARLSGARPDDRYTAADEDEMGRDAFLRSVVGVTERTRAELVARMRRGSVAFSPVLERVQGRLPGIG